LKWEPPSNCRIISTVDAHAAGEPLRVIISGIDPIPGETILAKRQFARQNLDQIRRSLMFEPRGHADMYGALVTEPVTKDGDVGILFMHNEGWSTMCGHGVIAFVTVALETNIVRARESINLDTPAGRVTASAILNKEGTRVEKASFENVPSFVYSQDNYVDLPGIGKIKYDIAFGGAFYAFVDAADLGIEIIPENTRRLIDLGTLVKNAVMKEKEIRHPIENDLSFLYGTIITCPPLNSSSDSRNVCIFADGEVDRSPTGTGVSARLAIECSRGRLGIGDNFIVESLIGTIFEGQVLRKVKFAGYDAVIPKVSGRAWITGRHEFLIYEDDPLRTGFLIR
jgi:proline racemase